MYQLHMTLSLERGYFTEYICRLFNVPYIHLYEEILITDL